METTARDAKGSRPWQKLELAAGLVVLLFCAATALTQFVNPCPPDGWFESQHRIGWAALEDSNYTPIAAPAFLYATVHHLATIFGGNLEAEFYLASLVHHVLLLLAGLCLYLSHRCLGLWRAGLVSSALMVVFLESTLIPQSAVSENVGVFLMAMILMISLYLLTNPGLRGPRFVGLTVFLGLLLGLFVNTRAVPILMLPALILLVWRLLPRDRVVRFALVATVAVFFVVAGAMTMNVFRYGRFELSNSTGRHLWNAVSETADVMLVDSREYQLLKQAQPDVQGKPWWDVMEPSGIAGLNGYSREELLKKLAFDAISAHPVLFARRGASTTRVFLRSRTYRYGLDWAGRYNPLNRTANLPAMIRPWPALDNFLARFHSLSGKVYGRMVWGTLLLGFAVFAVGAVAGKRSRAAVLRRRVWLFSTGLFLSSLYLSCLIEIGNSRYVVPYLPLLALMASTTAGALTDLVRRRGAERRIAAMDR